MQARAHEVDSTISFFKDPYRFISTRAQELHTEVFEMRLLMRRTICMTGREAAALFTHPDLFERKGAQPEILTSTLLGKGGMQGLDGESHYLRKSLFMNLLDPSNTEDFIEVFSGWLKTYTDHWIRTNKVSLYEEFQEVLTRALFMWIGLDLPRTDVKERTKELTALFDKAASLKGHVFSRRERKKSEKWMVDLVQEIRSGKRPDLSGSPIFAIALFRDEKGKELPTRTAAVEALNLMRPIVAVSVYLVFCVHALHHHPDSRRRIKAQEPGYLDLFVNEVRRAYPFFPAVVAKVRTDFEWKKFFFRKGTRVMLDLYGINHDPKVWKRPFDFFPDRFKDWEGDLYQFVPQGVGDHHFQHRCPGEFFTIELMRKTVLYFCHSINYDVVSQNTALDMARLPALPREKLLISNVQRSQAMEELVMHL